MNEFSILCRVLGSLYYRQPQDPLLVPLFTLIREGLVVNPRLGLRGELAPYMFPAVTDQEKIGFPIVCHGVLPSALVTSGAGVCLFVILRVLILDLSY